jgi:hypothetical protein
VVVTGDAAFTYRRIVEAILAGGGHCFLFVKADQPELQAELAFLGRADGLDPSFRPFGDASPLEARQSPRSGA